MAHKLKFSWWSGNTQWGILTVLATIKQSDYCAQYESRYLLRWEHTGNTGAEELVKRRKIVNRVLYFHATPSIIRCGDIVALKAEGNVIKYGNRKYDLFEENATLILLSCLSGKKGGIGSEISKAMDVKTIAPKESSGLESIKPILKENDLKFKVRYSHHVKAATFRPRKKQKEQEFI